MRYGKMAVAMLALGQGWISAAGVEMARVRGFAFVEVRVNGAGPFRMLLDTGADSCALSVEAAEAAGLKYDFRVRMSSPAGESLVPVAAHNQVSAGADVRGGVEVARLDMAAIRQIDGRADGVLGQSFLRQGPYLMDYRQRELWLGEEAVERSKGLPVEAGGGSAGGTIVPVRLDAGGRTWRLRLDSGASDLVLECGGRCPRVAGAEGADVVTNHGQAVGARTMVGEVRIGGARLGGRDAVLVAATNPDFDGLLPARWFDAVFVDSARDVVRLAPAR